MSGVPNICDYVKRNLKTFDECPLNRVDSLVFSWFAYFRFPEEAVGVVGDEGLAIKDLYRADWFEAMIGPLYDPDDSLDLLLFAAASPRFRDIRVSNYVQDTNEIISRQFSGTAFRISDTETYVGFRGTDNTMVGWKEDLNMSFADTVPSQLSAVGYLEHVAARSQGRLWCGGHSKGGNLAVYASVMAADEVRNRVLCAFTHDGPGFPEKMMRDERWQSSRVYIDKTIPQSSVIGMLFENQEIGYKIVHSDATGFYQHDPFSWEVNGLDFVEVPELGGGATRFDKSLNSYLANSQPEEREHIVDAIFSVLEASGEDTFAGVKANWKTAFPKMAIAASVLDAKERSIVLNAVGKIVGKMLPSKEQLSSLASYFKPSSLRDA